MKKTFKQLQEELKIRESHIAIAMGKELDDEGANYMSSKNEEYVSEAAEKRYCPKCKKKETKSECSYGPEYWEKNAKKM